MAMTKAEAARVAGLEGAIKLLLALLPSETKKILRAQLIKLQREQRAKKQ